jgi:uncharacterized membrane protein (DUF4010 family)
MADGLDAAWHLLVAALGGAAVGIEREWSGKASGREERIGGIRTFTLLGGLAGLAGYLGNAGAAMPAALLLGGAAALVVASYVAASRADVDGTTEVAALVVLGAGYLAGTGAVWLTSMAVAVTCLLLVEKSRLHAFVARLDDVELRAAAHFAVLAVVVLPLLPEGPIGPFGGVRPRTLWMLVLLFAGLGFAGYVARRAVGPARGYVVAGFLGGLVSSTGVTLTFARGSRRERAMGASLARGVVAACTVMFVRMLAALAILSPVLAVHLLPVMVAPTAAGAAWIAWARRSDPESVERAASYPANPLQLRNALQMAVLFQVVLMVVHAANAWWGEVGLVASGAFLGLTDVDALTVAMAASVDGGTTPLAAARAVGVGALVNTLLKLGLVLALGAPGFRVRAAMPLLGLAAVTAVTLALTLA